MAEPRNCPSCGTPLPSDWTPDHESLVFASQPSQTIETVVPATLCGDDGTGHLTEPRDPRFKIADDAKTEADRPVLRDSGEFPSSGSDEFDPLAAPVADPLLDVIANTPTEVPPTNLEPAPAVSVASAKDSQSSEVEYEVVPTQWPSVLLASYASAMTIAVAWLLWQGRGRAPEVVVDTMPVPTKVEREKSPVSLPMIKASSRTSLGKPLVVGSVEFTPLSFSSGSILQVFSKPGGEKQRSDSPQCLILKVRIKNISKDTAFAPLDPTFVRASDTKGADSLIQIGENIIESFPLSVSSEISIAGQSFSELKPGESTETILASEPFSRGSLTSPALWRVPLRVSPDTTALIGVDLSPSDLR